MKGDQKHERFIHLWLFVLLIVGIPGCADSYNSAKSKIQPNILWITVEDMSPHLGSYGNDIVSTPHLDRLASQGTRYSNVFATAPVCSAARTALITGMYQSSIGGHQHRTRQSYDNFVHAPYQAVPPPHVKAFTEYLRSDGYYSVNNAKTDYNFGNPITAWDESSRGAHWRNRPDLEQPFFAVFNTSRTHESRVWPNPEEEAVLDPDSITLPPYYPDTPIIRRDYARHLDNISRMDEWVNELLQQLEEDGLADNTIVFFFSDHGDGIPRGKRWLQDSGIQTPLIIRNPYSSQTGAVDDQLISFIDLPATVLSLAGVDIPEHFQGQAFMGAGAAETPRELIFAARDRMDESHDMRRAVRDDRFKYIRNFHPEIPFLPPNRYRDRMPLMQELIRLSKSGALNPVAAAMFAKTKPEEELYDTLDDPHEIVNLATDPEFEDVLKRMRRALADWQDETGDMGLIPETELSEMMWPSGIQPVTEEPRIESTKVSPDSVDVSISSPTPGASIAFTVDMSEDPAWSLYSKPIRLPAGAVVRAVAVRYGYKQSEEVSSPLNLDEEGRQSL